MESFPTLDLGESAKGPKFSPPPWEISLADGRVAYLMRFQQKETYAGMLCGLPTDPYKIIRGAITAARQWDTQRHENIAVVPATITSGRQIVPPSWPKEIGPIPWQALPPVMTFAIFHSSTPAKDREECYSSGLFLWWQDRYGLPEDSNLLKRLSAVDWSIVADDWTP